MLTFSGRRFAPRGGSLISTRLFAGGTGLAACVSTVCLLAGALSARAGTFISYSNRTTWETPAAAAGLTVTTETFASSPAGFPNFAVGPVNFSASGSAYNGANQRLDQSGGSDILLDFTSITAGQQLFGLAYNYSPDGDRIRVTDVDGAQGLAGDTGTGFVGIIGTRSFDPANPSWSFPEIHVDAFPPDWLDNLSVATQVPEPSSCLMAVSATALLVGPRRHRMRNDR